jgi:hypothetical protein
MTTLQHRGRIASVLPQDKKWLGTALTGVASSPLRKERIHRYIEVITTTVGKHINKNI